VRADGIQGNGDSGLDITPRAGFFGLSAAGNGQFTSFLSGASNLVDNDNNGFEDVFLATTGFSQPALTPLVTLLGPNSAAHGGGDFELVVAGARFVPGAQVQWNGSPRDTTYIDNATLKAFIPASDIALQGRLRLRWLTLPQEGHRRRRHLRSTEVRLRRLRPA
jgi:hypothetical protein